MVFDSMQGEVYPCPKAPRRGEGPGDEASGGTVQVVFCLQAVSSSWSLECKKFSHSLCRLSGWLLHILQLLTYTPRCEFNSEEHNTQA